MSPPVRPRPHSSRLDRSYAASGDIANRIAEALFGRAGSRQTRTRGNMAPRASRRDWRAGSPIRRRAATLFAGVLALVAQLVLAPLHPAVGFSGSAKLAELIALTGQDLVLCEHATGEQPSAPDHSDCDYGSLCCQLSHAVAVDLPRAPTPVGAVPRQTARLAPPATISVHADRRSSLTLPRGPPRTV
jgi:hypothetical protein